VNKFKPGDVVQLASGGAKMTVAGPGQRGCLTCLWFTEGGRLDRADLPEEVLVKAGGGTGLGSTPAPGRPPP
jgi:uncharacterized protein YodC (DUF2158 family)